MSEPSAKARARGVLDSLPDDCTMEDVQYRLFVADKIRRRLDQCKTDEAVTQAEAEKRLDKWRIK